MQKIYISPSNQYQNTYYDRSRNEKEVMEKVGQLLFDKLLLYDVQPILNPSKSIEDREKEANALRVDYYLAIHTNGNDGINGRGCETLYQAGFDNPLLRNQLSKEFATMVNEEISAITSSNPRIGDRGVKKWLNTDNRDYLGEMRNVDCPVAYTEIEFHDTPIGCAWILANIENIADALCRAVVRKMGLSLKDRKNISYMAHVQNIGNQPRMSNGQTAGTLARGLAIEAITFSTDTKRLLYRAHVQDIGWQLLIPEDMIAGTMGLGKRMEALEITLPIDGYQLKARGHIQDSGWQPYQIGKVITLGSVGLGKRLEAIEVEIVKV